MEMFMLPVFFMELSMTGKILTLLVIGPLLALLIHGLKGAIDYHLGRCPMCKKYSAMELVSDETICDVQTTTTSSSSSGKDDKSTRAVPATHYEYLITKKCKYCDNVIKFTLDETEKN